MYRIMQIYKQNLGVFMKSSAFTFDEDKIGAVKQSTHH